jgi:hypothetical protein
MYLQDAVSVLVADEAQAFADQVVRGYRDQELWERLSEAGLAVMDAHFSFSAARQALAALVQS